MEGGIWRARPAPSWPARRPPPSPDLAEREQAREELRQDLAARARDHAVEIEVRDSKTPTLSRDGPAGQRDDGHRHAGAAGALGPFAGQQDQGAQADHRRGAQDPARRGGRQAARPGRHRAEALDRAQNDGIIFVDEIDKIVSSGGSDGPDVSREGVQRDLLSVVEGCAVYTRYGHVRTDHVLFLAAGAFHFHKPSELIPELQGRFPVRVALQSLTEADFVRILDRAEERAVPPVRRPVPRRERRAVVHARTASKLAALAFKANKTTQDIGARRLMTILEKCLEDLSFDASERPARRSSSTASWSTKRLGDAGDDTDLIPYRL
jgi:ATP-dependent HslUV protease ATP-binding subunit HslU